MAPVPSTAELWRRRLLKQQHREREARLMVCVLLPLALVAVIYHCW